MNRKILFGTALLCSSSLLCARLAAAPFQNLDLEHPHLPLIPNDPFGYNRVPITDAFPGWNAYLGSNAETLVLNNMTFLDSAGLAIVGPGEWTSPLYPRNVIAGNHTAFLQTGVDIFHGGGDNVSVSLAQLGLVPSDAQSLRISVDAIGPFSVALGGQSLDLIPLEVAANYTTYGADLSRFADQTAELRITIEAWSGMTTNGYVAHSHLWLDSISFSTEPVPEPATVALLLAGGMLLGWRWRTCRGRC